MIDLTHVVGTHLPRWAAPFFPDLLWRVPTPGKTAYLTFDDGPTPSSTLSLLDILDRFDAGATFFLLGRHAERDPGLVRAIAEAGHVIGNHTYSHANAWKTKPAAVLAELERTTSILEDLIQQPLRWMRPPYGHFTRSMRQWCRVRRQRCTMWDVGPADFLSQVTRADIERRILRAIRPGSIIVLHDNRNAYRVTPPALTNVLSTLKKDGWSFSSL
ncbi:MAG: polysaccharide deacetylase family protein [Rhodothermales bacterium]